MINLGYVRLVEPITSSLTHDVTVLVVYVNTVTVKAMLCMLLFCTCTACDICCHGPTCRDSNKLESVLGGCGLGRDPTHIKAFGLTPLQSKVNNMLVKLPTKRFHRHAHCSYVAAPSNR